MQKRKRQKARKQSYKMIRDENGRFMFMMPGIKEDKRPLFIVPDHIVLFAYTILGMYLALFAYVVYALYIRNVV